MSSRDQLPPRSVILAVAARACVDPRTVERELLQHDAVRGDAGVRIRAVLRQLGIGLGMPPSVGATDVLFESAPAFPRGMAAMAQTSRAR